MDEKQHISGQQIPPHIDTPLWKNAILFSLLTFIFLSLYLFARRGTYDLYIANKAFASCSIVLIGLSLALSGICYFFDFLDAKIIYRKHLGIIGFIYAVVHSVLSLYFLTDHFPFPQYYAANIPPFLAAIASLMILIIMAAISNKYAVKALGGKRWRLLLRSGYVAFFFAFIHIAIKKYPGWIEWTKTQQPSPLPPLSLLITVFVLFVFVLRVALWMATSKKSHSPSTPSQPPSPMPSESAHQPVPSDYL